MRIIFRVKNCILFGVVFALSGGVYADIGSKRACPPTISPDVLERMIEGGDLSSGGSAPLSVAGVTYELKASEGRLKMLRVKLSKAFKLSVDKMSYTDIDLDDDKLIRKHGNEQFSLAPHVDMTFSKLLGKMGDSLLCGYIIKRDGQFLYHDTTEEMAVKITFTK